MSRTGFGSGFSGSRGDSKPSEAPTQDDDMFQFDEDLDWEKDVLEDEKAFEEAEQKIKLNPTFSYEFIEESFVEGEGLNITQEGALIVLEHLKRKYNQQQRKLNYVFLNSDDLNFDLGRKEWQVLENLPEGEKIGIFNTMIKHGEGIKKHSVAIFVQKIQGQLYFVISDALGAHDNNMPFLILNALEKTFPKAQIFIVEPQRQKHDVGCKVFTILDIKNFFKMKENLLEFVEKSLPKEKVFSVSYKNKPSQRVRATVLEAPVQLLKYMQQKPHEIAELLSKSPAKTVVGGHQHEEEDAHEYIRRHSVSELEGGNLRNRSADDRRMKWIKRTIPEFLRENKSENIEDLIEDHLSGLTRFIEKPEGFARFILSSPKPSPQQKDRQRLSSEFEPRPSRDYD